MWFFGYKAECEICGKRGFEMTKDRTVYCKRHWDYYFDNVELREVS